jgi:hypothetical protein
MLDAGILPVLLSLEMIVVMPVSCELFLCLVVVGNS